MKRNDWIELAVMLIVVILIRSFIITPARVDGPSMQDTLKDGSIILVNKLDYSLNQASRFEIVVIKLKSGDRLIKRVIGLPGESVEYKDNVLYINGEVVEPPFEFKTTKDFKYDDLKEGEYFVLGDNRGNSMDSRMIGPIDESEIYGTVHFVLFPFKEFGKVN